MNDDTAAENAAQRQLDAYNAQDLEVFLAVYAPDIEIRTLGDEGPALRGHDAMRARYRALFDENPEQRCELLSRMALGRFVVDHERITGRSHGRTVHAIAIYEVIQERIARVWFIREAAIAEPAPGAPGRTGGRPLRSDPS